MATNDFERVSQVVGKAGKVNARLSVADLHGSWAKLVDSSNTLIENLVSPLNEMVRVINAVSTGDLSQTAPSEIDGKKLEGQFLKSAMMVNGKLGGQAEVKGVGGTWKDLTESVNTMVDQLSILVVTAKELDAKESAQLNASVIRVLKKSGLARDAFLGEVQTALAAIAGSPA